MAEIDADNLLTPISADAPSGEDLEYDAVFAEMERASQGKPEQQYGDTIIPAEEPDWKELRSKALALFQRTRDLRVASNLARASLKLDGVAAFAAVLKVMRGLCENFWDTVHPQLDPDDDLDPTLRVNTIQSLADVQSTLRYLLETPIVSVPGLGRFSYNDIQIAKGEVPLPAGADKIELATVEAAFQNCELEQLQQASQACGEAVEHVGGLEAAVTQQVGASNAPNLEKLVSTLKHLQSFVSQQLSRRGAGEPDDAAADELGEASSESAGAAGEAGAGATSAAAAAPTKTLQGEVRSRDDVIRAIEMICKYYERSEPSSPVPLLLNRAKRLATKSFLEILQDLSPGGLNEALAIGGVHEESSTESE